MKHAFLIECLCRSKMEKKFVLLQMLFYFYFLTSSTNLLFSVFSFNKFCHNNVITIFDRIC
jgi:hypothetical protein